MAAANTGNLRQLHPLPDVQWIPGQPLDFSWTDVPGAGLYNLELEHGNGSSVFSAWLQSGVIAYRAPDWALKQTQTDLLQWRVTALDFDGKLIGRTVWRKVRLDN